MLSAWSRQVLLGVMLLLAACSSSGDAGPAPGPPNDGGAGAGEGVSFDGPVPLEATPSQAVPLGLTVTNGDTDVSVWLEGDYLDASLSADTVTTQGGHGTVTLHTPSVTATFRVGAKIDGGTAVYLEVSISNDGYGSVRVMPSYPGKRTALDFRASVFPSTTCDDLKGLPIKDGGLAADGKFGQPIVIDSVPAGAHLAIGVHVARFAVGCADVDPLVPSKTVDVPVTVYDVPMALDRTDLDMTLAFDPEAADRDAWSAMLAAAVDQTGGAFFAGGSEGTALLNAMRAEIVASADQAQFDQTRQQQGWDAKAQAWLTSHAPSMHDRAMAWMTAVKSDPIGSLALHLAPGLTAGTATGTAVSFGALSASAAGLTLGPSLVWTADAADTVHLSGGVTLGPTPLVAHLADAHALKDAPAASDVASAIASLVDCAGMTSSIVGSGYLYGQCAATCAADACRAAIAGAWTKATDPASGVAAASITVTASGLAKVGDDAEPLTVDGAWVGQVTASTGASAMKGAMSAKKPGTN